MMQDGRYTTKKDEFSDDIINGENNNVFTIEDVEKVYSFDDAIELAGNGWYNINLTLLMCLAFIAMSVEINSLSMILGLSKCDLELDNMKTSVLMSMPFLGPVLMSYTWGYIADTRGRKYSLLIAISGSYVASTISAFSPNWIVLAFLKLIAACLCSCVLSVAFTLLGESCADRVKSTYMLIIASVIHFNIGIIYSITHFVEKMDFSYNLGFINFVPWRLLTVIMGTPCAFCALGLVFFCESPKFLYNAGREAEAIEVLKEICRRNGRDVLKYPVKKLMLKEEGNFKTIDLSLMQSLWQQTVPLFRPPLLRHTLIIFYHLMIIYSVNPTLCVWLPFLSKAFTEGINGDEAQNICQMISKNANVTSDLSCDSLTGLAEIPMVISTVTSGIVLFVAGNILSKMASRKKCVFIISSLLSCACCILAVNIGNSVGSIVLYFGSRLIGTAVGIPFAYTVDLYPTSVRGMIACLGVMAARVSSLFGINLIGPYLMTDCTGTFYFLAMFIFSGALLALLLPPDKPNKAKTGQM